MAHPERRSLRTLKITSPLLVALFCLMGLFAQAGEVLNHSRWLKEWRTDRLGEGKKEFLLDHILYLALIYCELIDESVQLQIEAAKRCDRVAYDKAVLEKYHFIYGLEKLLRDAESGLEGALATRVSFYDWLSSFNPFVGSSMADQMARLKDALKLPAEPKAERPSVTTSPGWISVNKARPWFDPAANGGVEYISGFYPANPAEEAELLKHFPQILKQCIEGLTTLQQDIGPRLEQEKENDFWKDCPPPGPLELDFSKLSKELSDFQMEFHPLVDLRELVGKAYERMSKEDQELIDELRINPPAAEREASGSVKKSVFPVPDTRSRSYRNDAGFNKWAEETSKALGLRDLTDEDGVPLDPGRPIDDQLTEAMFRTLPEHVRQDVLMDMWSYTFDKWLHGYLDHMVYDRYLMRLKKLLPHRKIPCANSAARDLNHRVIPFDDLDPLMKEVIRTLQAEDVMPNDIDPVFLSTIRNDYNNLRQGIYTSALLQRPMTATERKTAEYFLTEPHSVDLVKESDLWLKGPCAELGGRQQPATPAGDIARVINPAAPGPAENQAYALRIKAEQGSLFAKYRRWSADLRLSRSLDPHSWMVPPKPGKSAPILQAPRPATEGLGPPPRVTIPRPKL